MGATLHAIEFRVSIMIETPYRVDTSVLRTLCNSTDVSTEASKKAEF